MPKVPEPTPQEVRDYLSPISHWAHLKANAEDQYRKTILAAYAARIPIVHIARYTGTSPQAVKKVIDRQNEKAAAESQAYRHIPRAGFFPGGHPIPPRPMRAV
ncbi:hypothetical protein P0W64_02280 [Tsukamurella sp. 8F]|uniref:hypothetical protein n=1 Tax=unclassified Tsukamurella TaxID=2633480 RepID=UPI0023B9EA0D|nr:MULTISPECIES: hypothetical protein [unclassified Tsukamurella]MDF0528637.1 hypothetical protein [Tsukamurella sp. 8J]MDF0585599.1 hypothetical protein [Tsukamurella sp. 8F]